MLLFNFADVRAGFLSKSVQIFWSPSYQPYSLPLPLICSYFNSTLPIANHPRRSLQSMVGIGYMIA